VAVAFEEAATNKEATASQAASEPVGHEDAAGYDAVFSHEDAWGFLQCLRVAQDLYSEECKRSHYLYEQLNALEVVLENTEGSLAQTKERLAESDSAIINKFILPTFSSVDQLILLISLFVDHRAPRAV
jgi:hypothetical protein